MSTKLFCRDQQPDCPGNGRPALERRSPLLLKDSEIVLMSTKWILQRIWLWISSTEGRCALLGGMVSSPHGFEKCAHEHKTLPAANPQPDRLQRKRHAAFRTEWSSSLHGFGKSAHEHKTLSATNSYLDCVRRMDMRPFEQRAPFSPRDRKMCS